ncbi:hypothetical protein KY284_004121 [Solanum tuberosum]|uniref:Uncharacterized protein n=1 Tax=Solanum tuberosum TaxID=4113 RepID=M1A990_SOLTU|nr:hypothetical protein KY284_004121 [Solanum tuberosum]
MAVATKLVVFFAILCLFCICFAHASEGCPFKYLYQQYASSISIDHRQPPSIHVNNNTSHDHDFFAQHQWLRNHIIAMHTEKSIGNNEYNNWGSYMADAAKIVGFFVVLLAILRLFCVDHAPKECPFKFLYKKYGNSISSSSTSTADGTFIRRIDHHQQASNDPGAVFYQQQWLKNHISMMQKKIGIDN